MKKDVIAVPLLPFTEDEQAALAERLAAMDSVALGHYADSARQALGNKALDASWRPRIQHGLAQAEAELARQALLEPVVAVDEPAAAKSTKTKKAAAKVVETTAEVDDEEEQAEA